MVKPRFLLNQREASLHPDLDRDEMESGFCPVNFIELQLAGQLPGFDVSSAVLHPPQS